MIQCSALLQSSFLPWYEYLWFKIFLPYVLVYVFISPKSHIVIFCLYFKSVSIFIISIGVHSSLVSSMSFITMLLMPSSIDLMKMLNKVRPDTNPYGTPVQHTGIFITLSSQPISYLTAFLISRVKNNLQRCWIRYFKNSNELQLLNFLIYAYVIVIQKCSQWYWT